VRRAQEEKQMTQQSQKPMQKNSARMLPAVWTLLIGAVAIVTNAPSAQALPSYARQTGQECAACHNGFPELTPYGRLFKLNGYTFRGGTSNLPGFAAMVIPTFTHTEADQPGGAAPHFGPNDNLSLDTASLFYGAAITNHIGVFSQVTYDGIGRRFSWDNIDLRYARATNVMGSELVVGATLNNNPTVTDPYNTTPAWSFPWVSSGLAPSPGASTLIEGGLAQQVAGITTYGFWNRLVYAEIGGYRSLSRRTDITLGVDPNGTSSIQGVAPYWRFAIEPRWGRNSFEIGTFGIAATVIPGRVRDFGTDHLTDIGFDTQYQFLGERDSFSLQASYITENQNLGSTFAQGGSENSHNHLRSLHAKGTYWYRQKYGASVGYFRVDGSADALLFGPTSINNSPNSQGYIGELNYMPFAYGGPDFWPWANLKLSLQYVYYDKFNGGRTNFDGTGRNAHDNNTLFLFAWIAF
jgi:hypothetical protein